VGLERTGEGSKSSRLGIQVQLGYSFFEPQDAKERIILEPTVGKYLSNDQIRRAKKELTLLFALPFAKDLFGTAWEQILADVKGGIWTGKRDNRPNPDLYVDSPTGKINYSVKCEGLKTNGVRPNAKAFLGHKMDFIIARPKADELLERGQTISKLDATRLGSLVLEYYNEQIVKKYQWHVLSFMVPVDTDEFIYWEEAPPKVYNPKDYWWKDTGKATGSNRNIAGYPKAVSRRTRPLPPSSFRWTSGGKQFYAVYEIPTQSDVFKIERVQLTREELWAAIEDKIAQKKRIAGQPTAT